MTPKLIKPVSEFTYNEPVSRLEASYLEDSYQGPLSILDDVDDDYRITIYKIKGEQRPVSRGYSRDNQISIQNIRGDKIPSFSTYRATADKAAAERAIQDILMI